MYPTEKKLGKYKWQVKGSISEGYLFDGCMTFCSMYLHGIEIRWIHEERNVDRWLEERSIGLYVFSQ